MEGYSNEPIPKQAAKELLALPLEDKVFLSREKIEQWYSVWGGKCYVSFSGGKDSTVLAYLAAQELSRYRTPIYPLTLVFVNTGLEYPEIQHFVTDYAAWLQKQFPRIEVQLVRLRPKLNIRQVLTKYGYPVISKRVSAYVQSARNDSDCMRAKWLRGEEKTIFVSGGTWSFLVDAPFNISDRCCAVMKKTPMNRYRVSVGEYVPITAMMASESKQRENAWKHTGCNAFDGKRPMSKPMSFWAEQDVLAFLKGENIPYCSVYGEIVASDGENDYPSTLIEKPLHCTGCQRTGCMFCAFGAHLEKGENRFERMRQTHPKHYDFCIGGGAYDPADGMWKPNEKGLGYGRVLDFIGVRY